MMENEKPEQWHDYEDGLVLLPDDGKKHFFDDRKNVRKFIGILFICCALLFLLDVVFLFEHKHLSFSEGEFPAEGWFGFYGFYGFVACVLLVLLAKHVMRTLLMRKEDYYEQ